MKKITLTLGFMFTLLFIGCSTDGIDGVDGRDGRDGIDGEDGVNVTGTIFEIEGSFTPENEYLLDYTFPTTVEVLETDIVLVYILWDQTVDSNNVPVDIWRLLPQTRLLDQGILQYNFDHTFFDVNIFMEADFGLETLTPADTDDQVFRVAILPADMGSGKLNTSNMKDVMGAVGIKENDIIRTNIE